MSITSGLQQAFGRYLVISGEYIWKYTHSAYDFSVLGNTPITYPIEWAQLQDPRLCHPRQRAELPRLHGVRGDVQRGGAFLHGRKSAESGPRRRASASAAYSASTTTRIFNSDHPPAISDRKEGTVDRLQLAL